MKRMPGRPCLWQAGLCLGLMLGHWNVSHAGDWLRFRGPNGSGVSTDPEPLPVTWSPTEHLKWKVPLPGPGSSSPIIVGQRVLVTCWSGYGTDRADAGQMENLRRHLVCLDLQTGKTLWQRDIAAVLPEDRYGGMFAEHGYASHTPTSDGERVYVYFGKTGALAFDLDGKQLWQTGVGKESDPRGWGSASSPVLYKDLLIVTAPAESEALVALNTKTGAEVWRQEARGFSSLWGTPVLLPVQDHTELVIAVPGEIWAFNPETGKLRWYCLTAESDSYCASVATDGEMVFALETRGGQTTAVRVGGQNDVTATHVAWHGRENARITTPLVYDGRIYLFSGGIVSCLDARSGERLSQARLSGGTPGDSANDPGRGAGQPDRAGADRQGGPPGGPARGGFGGRGRGGMGGQNYSSPILADGKIFYVTRGGDIHVIRPGPQLESLAVNRVTADNEDFSATPAVSSGRLLIRSSKFLYCVSQ